mmetsp:Transcript_14143/g.32189  ORF Transcript_14143/g.32189 Transcript_14143/m.32189 type:complete len:105 (-) Transcript_14143:69-383(-)
MRRDGARICWRPLCFLDYGKALEVISHWASKPLLDQRLEDAHACERVRVEAAKTRLVAPDRAVAKRLSLSEPTFMLPASIASLLVPEERRKLGHVRECIEVVLT